MHPLHQLPLAADRKQNHQKRGLQKPLRRNRGPASVRVKLLQLAIHPLLRPVHQHPNLPRRVVGWNPLLQRYIAEHRRLLLIVSTHTSFLRHLPVEKQ
jgi:hypothetical protein